MKIRFHYYIVYLLIKISPKLFYRYRKDYEDAFNNHCEDVIKILESRRTLWTKK